MNKQVLITGATQNTGFCIAQRFAERGYDLHITGRRTEDAEKAAKALASSYPDISVYPYCLELSDNDSIKALFQEIRKNTESLDVFVANAAHLGVDYDIYNTDQEAFDSIIHTNVRGNFFCCQECGKLMTQNGGSIVLMSSVQSKGAIEGRTVYGITKAAMNAMAKYLAFDFAPYGIRVNALLAGAIHTERWEHFDEAALAEKRKNYMAGRESEMDEIANGVLYLAEDAGKTTTGIELVMDSGVLSNILPYQDRKYFQRSDYER